MAPQPSPTPFPSPRSFLPLASALLPVFLSRSRPFFLFVALARRECTLAGPRTSPRYLIKLRGSSSRRLDTKARTSSPSISTVSPVVSYFRSFLANHSQNVMGCGARRNWRNRRPRPSRIRYFFNIRAPPLIISVGELRAGEFHM